MIDLNKYELLNEMGTGGAAKVFRVLEKSTNAIRAMRCIDLSIEEMSAIKQDYYYEHRVLARLESGRHPAIIRSSFIEEDQNSLYMLVDYICGDTLEDYVTKVCHGYVPYSEVLTMTKEIASALSYCHVENASYCHDMSQEACQVIHNDIHARNIMRHRNGHYVLMDFDLVLEGADQPSEILIEGSEQPLIPKRVGGAPDYKAPEKWTSDIPITPATDIYSFGVLLFFFLTGEVPFPFMAELSNQGIDDQQIVEKLFKAKVPSIYDGRKAAYERNHSEGAYERDYPGWLEKIVTKCLCKMPEDRFTNGKELYDFISQNITEESSRSANITTKQESASSQNSNNSQSTDYVEEIIQLRKEKINLQTDEIRLKMDLQRKGNVINALKDQLRDLNEDYDRQQRFIDKLKNELSTAKAGYPLWALISCIGMSFVITVILMVVYYYYYLH